MKLCFNVAATTCDSFAIEGCIEKASDVFTDLFDPCKAPQCRQDHNFVQLTVFYWIDNFCSAYGKLARSAICTFVVLCILVTAKVGVF